MKTRLTSIAGAAIGALLASVTPALANGTDYWTQWTSAKQDTWIRSLDFTSASTLVASSDGDGIFQAPATLGPWTQTNGGLDSPGDQSAYEVVASGGKLYAATSGGLFTAPQGGGDWSQLGGGTGDDKLNMGGIESVVVESPTSLVVAVSGAANPGVYTSSDGGATWTRASGMPAGENIFHLAQGAGPVIYAAGDSGVWTSVNGGNSWTLTSDGIDPAETTFRVAVDPLTPNELWAAADNDVYKSTNGGLTWTNIDGAGAGSLPGAQLKAAFLLAASYGDGRALVGTDDGVWATIDTGVTWGQMSPDTTLAGGDGVFGHRIVSALGIGFTPPALLAGTQGFGVYSIPLTPVSAPNALSLNKTSGVRPGDRLTYSGTFTGTRPFFFTYAWRRCQGSSCTTVGTGKSYVVPNSDAANASAYFHVTVCAKNLLTSSPACATSNSTVPGVAGIPSNAPVPWHGINDSSLSPNPAVSYPWGQTFTIHEGDWGTEASAGTKITPSGYAYMWERCTPSACTVIPDATERTYTTTVADVGDGIEGFVQAFNGGFASQMYFAGGTFTIIEKTPVNTVAPQIIGAPYVGETLNSTAGAWDGHDPTYTREWLECGPDGLDCQPLQPDQTASTYTLTSADLGSRLELQVTATQADPSQDRVGQATSAPTDVITNPPAGGGGGGTGGGGGGSGGGGGGGGGGSNPTIRISGPRHLHVGARLAGPASVAGYTGVAYQWLRNGRSIKHANRGTYKLTKSDLGRRIALRVRLTRPSGGTLVLVSNTIYVPKAGNHNHGHHQRHKHRHHRHHRHRHHRHRHHRHGHHKHRRHRHHKHRRHRKR